MSTPIPDPGEFAGLKKIDVEFITCNQRLIACWAFAAWSVIEADERNTPSKRREAGDNAAVCLEIARGQK